MLSQINLLLPCWYPYSISVLIFLSAYSVFQRTMEQETQGTTAASLADRDHRTELLPVQRGLLEHCTSNHWSARILVTLTGVTHTTIRSREISGCLVLKRLNVSCWKSLQNKPSIVTDTNRQGSNEDSLIFGTGRKYSMCRPNLHQYKCRQTIDKQKRLYGNVSELSSCMIKIIAWTFI